MVQVEQLQLQDLTFVGPRGADVDVLVAVVVVDVDAVGQLPGDALRPHDVVPDQLIHKKPLTSSQSGSGQSLTTKDCRTFEWWKLAPGQIQIESPLVSIS